MVYQYSKIKKTLSELLILTVLASNTLLGIIQTYAVSSDPILSNGGYMQVIVGWDINFISPDYSGNDTYGCGLRDDNTLWCWGDNTGGKLWVGSNDLNIRTPQQVIFPVSTHIVYVAAQNQSLFALMEDGSLYAWGKNQDSDGNSLLSVGSSASVVTSPTLVQWFPLGEKIKALNTGTYNNTSAPSLYAITESGSLYVWGDNTQWQLGLGNTTIITNPTLMTSFPTGTKVKEIVTQVITWNKVWNGSGWGWSGSTIYAVLDNNDIYGWWTNACSGWTYGCLGIGETGNSSITTPTKVDGLPVGTIKNVLTIYNGIFGWWNQSTYGTSTYALYENGDIYSWGDNTNGQLGLWDTIHRSSPAKINTLSWAQDIYANNFGTVFAVMSDMGIYSWGLNDMGLGFEHCNQKNALGVGSANAYESTPLPLLWVQIPTGVSVKNIASITNLTTCTLSTILLSNGDVYGWGNIVDFGSPRMVDIPELLPYSSEKKPFIDILGANATL